MSDKKRMTKTEWESEGERRFGKDRNNWRFVCPSCGHIATVKDYEDAGAPEGTIAFSCIGRFLSKCNDAFQKGKSPCNYAGGGLFRINPVIVVDGNDEYNLFDFADNVTEVSASELSETAPSASSNKARQSALQMPPTCEVCECTNATPCFNRRNSIDCYARLWRHFCRC